MLRFIKKFEGRSFSCSSIRRDLQKGTPPAPSTPGSDAAKPPSSPTGGMNFVPSEFEKKILVLSGRYKSAKDIPERIGYETLEKAKSMFRIRLSNILMVGCLCMCGYYVWQGKKRLSEGDTINKRAMDRIGKITEEHKKSQAT